jgi:hypothetical protein
MCTSFIFAMSNSTKCSSVMSGLVKVPRCAGDYGISLRWDPL